jgi:microcystin-dependent protein
MSTLKVNEVRHLSNSGTANIVLESNATTNLQATSTLGLTVTGTLTTSGVATFNGNVVIGNATTDTLTLTSKVSGSNNYSGFTGEIRMYAGNAAGDDPPDGWLYCNGDTIGQTSGNHTGTELQNLFNLLSASALWENSGSEAWASATVKLPDFRSRSPVGIHTGAANSITAGLTSRTLSATAGTETHALVIAELASHTHVMTNPASSTGQTASQVNHTHSLSSHTHSLSSHTHSYAHTHNTGNQSASHTHSWSLAGWSNATNGNMGVGGNDPGAWGLGTTAAEQTGHTHTTNSQSTTTSGSPSNNTSGGPSTANTGNQSANTITLTDPTHTHASSAATTGSGTPHTILQPIIAVNYIIKV